MIEQSEDRYADYSAAGFGSQLGSGTHPALIVVDPVMAYVQKDSRLYASVEGEIGVITTLISAAHEREIPVFATRVVYRSDGLDGGLFFKKVPALAVFTAGSLDGMFVPNIGLQSDDIVIEKQYASAFFGTTLATMLHVMGIDTVIITGLTTSGCVRATAMDAINHGFIPLVVKDAVGDRDRISHEQNLFDMSQKCADVVDSGYVLSCFLSAH